MVSHTKYRDIIVPHQGVEEEGSQSDLFCGFLTQKELDPNFVDFNSVNRRYHFPSRYYIPFRGVFGQVDPLRISQRPDVESGLFYKSRYTIPELFKFLAGEFLSSTFSSQFTPGLPITISKKSGRVVENQNGRETWELFNLLVGYGYVAQSPTGKVDPEGLIGIPASGPPPSYPTDRAALCGTLRQGGSDGLQRTIDNNLDTLDSDDPIERANAKDLLKKIGYCLETHFRVDVECGKEIVNEDIADYEKFFKKLKKTRQDGTNEQKIHAEDILKYINDLP
jgi:hypothetical protein